MAAGKNIPVRILKILLWITGGIIALLIILILLIRLPVVQNFIVRKATSYVSGKTGTKVEIKHITIVFPKKIHIEGLYLEDQSADTLLWVKNLYLDVSLTDILSNELNIKSVDINQMRARVLRLYPDTTYNYSFLLKAFASDEPPKPSDTGGEPMKISLGRINLSGISINYDDTIAGIDASVRLGALNLSFKDFDIEKMNFDLNSFRMMNSAVKMVQTKPLDTISDTVSGGSLSPSFSAGKIELSGIQLNYQSISDTMKASVRLGSLKIGDVDFRGDTISYDEFSIGNTFLSYDKGVKYLNSGMDFNHLLVTGFRLESGKSEASSTHAKITLNHLSFGEKSGFLVKDIKSKIIFDSTHVDLAELDVITGNSRIRSRLAASYPSLNVASDSVEKVIFDLTLEQATVSMKDALFFMPELAKDTLLGTYKSESVLITGKVKGSLDDLSLEDFDLEAGDITKIKLTGKAKNLTNTDKLYADMKLYYFTTSESDIKRLIPPGIIPADISIPEFLEAEGFFRGNMKNFKGRLNVISSYGNAEAKVKMFQAEGGVPGYEADITTDDLNIGKFINQPDPGPMSLNLHVEGSGLDTATISAAIDLAISHVVFNGYDYHDFRLKGNLDKMVFDGTASVQDSNLMFSYKGITNLDQNDLSADLTLYLKGADLKALHFSESENKVSGSVKADISMAENGNIYGKISLINMLILSGKDEFAIDSVNLVSSEDNGRTIISLKYPGLTAGLDGTIVMQELGASFSELISNYYSLGEDTVRKNLKQQKFDFFIRLDDPALVEKLVPSLEHLTPFEIKGSFDSEAKNLNVTGFIPEIKYAGMTIDSLVLNVETAESKLTANITASSVFNNILRMENFSFDGSLADNTLDFRIGSERSDSGTMIALSGRLINEKAGMRIVLESPLVLSAEEWTVAPDNYILFPDSGMIAHTLNISRNGEELTLNSKGEDPESPLEAGFKNFQLANLSKIIEKDTQLVRGTLDGVFTLNSTGFTSDLKISDFSYMGTGIGDITLDASSSEKDLYKIMMQISGNDNELSLSGDYTAGEKDRINLNLDLKNLSLKTIEPFTGGQLKRVSGTATGNIKVSGSTSDPSLDGRIDFHEFGFYPVTTGSYFRMQDNGIEFKGRRLNLSDLIFTDSLNNKAVINGFADLADMKEPEFDITLVTKDFVAMNSKPSKDALVYGKIIVDSDIHLTGTPLKPFVNAKIKLNPGTNAVFVNPASEAKIVESEGIVVFTDSISRRHSIMARADSAGVTSAVTELDVTATIELDEEAMLKMMIDPTTGDSLYVKGSGVIGFRLDPSGTMSLTGSYKIKEGGYHLTIAGLVKRDFVIQEGSTIIWNGEIMEAQANITALYKVETSPLLLVEDQLSGAGDQEKNRYRNKLKFNVMLMMEGILKKPEISFDIDLDPEDRGAMGGVVYTKLAELREDESQLNKQVFALLALNRFIGQDPLESGNAPTTVSSAARSSASRLLTDQLNNLAERYVKGVDLEVGVKSYDDYSSGQAEGRTELELGVSKQFLQDKVTVKVGGSLDVEGQKASENDLSDIAGDVSIEYKLTNDGRLRLKGFRLNAYENPIDGELTRTGIGLIYTRDFNRISDLYRKEKGEPGIDKKK